MKRELLEDLWLSYELDNHIQAVEEEREISKEMSECEDIFRGQLSGEQKALLEKILDCMGRIHTIYEKKAFAHGVSFAVKFLLEAMHGE